MSILPLTVTLSCDWPGCERVFRSESSRPETARTVAADEGEGWQFEIRFDLCPIHPRHQAYAVSTELPPRFGCTSCGWADEEPIGPYDDLASAVRWRAHLPELMGDFGRCAGSRSDVERGAVAGQAVVAASPAQPSTPTGA
jgi:hypothetical protein